MRETFEKTGLSLPLDGSEDAEVIRFDGQGVNPVCVDSDEDVTMDYDDDSDSSDHRFSSHQKIIIPVIICEIFDHMTLYTFYL